jgi:hypothetical protein
MNDLGMRREQDPPSSGTDRRTEVDVFFVHEIPFIEQSGIDRFLASHEQACTGDPVDEALLADQALGRGPGTRRVPKGPSNAKGPATVAFVASRRPTSASSAPEGTIVSLLSSRMSGAIVWRIARLLAAANPMFRSSAITWVAACRDRTSSRLPSCDALSTTTTWAPPLGGCFAIE